MAAIHVTDYSHGEPTTGPLESDGARRGAGPSLGSFSASLCSILLHQPHQPATQPASQHPQPPPPPQLPILSETPTVMEINLRGLASQRNRGGTITTHRVLLTMNHRAGLLHKPSVEQTTTAWLPSPHPRGPSVLNMRQASYSCSIRNNCG